MARLLLTKIILSFVYCVFIYWLMGRRNAHITFSHRHRQTTDTLATDLHYRFTTFSFTRRRSHICYSTRHGFYSIITYEFFLADTLTVMVGEIDGDSDLALKVYGSDLAEVGG